MGSFENGRARAFDAAGFHQETELAAALRGMLAKTGVPMADANDCTALGLIVTVAYKRDVTGCVGGVPRTTIKGGGVADGVKAEGMAFMAVCGRKASNSPGLEQLVHEAFGQSMWLGRTVFTFGRAADGTLVVIDVKGYLIGSSTVLESAA